jgi:enoyl-CoA hydratase/carnithine racemase
MTPEEPAAYQRLSVAVADHVATIELARPEKANALDLAMWHELRTAMRWLDAAPQARVAILRGAGAQFSAGIDLALLAGLRAQIDDPCEGRTRENLRRVILDLQDTLTSIDRCRKPVIAAIHGACIGGAVDLALACDLRYCSADATFSVREIDVGLTADLGTLQRLPRLVGEGMARELAYTGRDVAGPEAQALGIVNRCYDDPAALAAGAGAIAAAIAAKSPLAVRGCKEMITWARDHSLADGLSYVATWNAAMLLSADLPEALGAARERRAPTFRD